MTKCTMPFLVLIVVLTGYLHAVNLTAEARDPNVPITNAEAIYGRVTDQYGQPLRTRVALWYPDLDETVTEELGEELTGAAAYDRQLFHAVHSDHTGYYNLEAIPGTWQVRMSRGPEYTIEEFKVTVDEIDGSRERDGQRHDITLKQLYERWGYDLVQHLLRYRPQSGLHAECARSHGS